MSKVVYRLRKLGIIDREAFEPNNRGNSQHKRYFANEEWRRYSGGTLPLRKAQGEGGR